MTAQDIDGKSIAAAVRAELTEKLASLPDGSSKPGLAVMLVGERKDSQVGIPRVLWIACISRGFLTRHSRKQDIRSNEAEGMR